MSAEIIATNATINEPATTEQSFKCVHIRHRYSENTPSKLITHASIESFYEDTLNPEDCVYEVLDKPIRRVYLDIEGIDMEASESHKLVRKIISDFNKFINVSVFLTHVTYNAGSTGHPGQSYHIIMNYSINYQLLKNIVIAFKQLHPEYGMYIDESVYSVIRLFRLPFQCKQRVDDIPDANDVHVPIDLETQVLMDKEAMDNIYSIIDLGPLHLPANLSGVEAVNMLRTYIDEAYNGYYGTNRANIEFCNISHKKIVILNEIL